MLFKNYDYFIAIVEEGGISKAAKKLYISQPSLSKYLLRLEDNLNVTLFDRTKTPLVLTYTGERYYRYIKEVIALDKKLQIEFSEINETERGVVNLGLALWRGSVLLPEILPKFVNDHPYIEIKLTEGISSFLTGEIINEKLDFAIMNLPMDMDFKNLSFDTLAEEEILLVGNEESPFVQKALQQNDVKGYHPYLDIKTIHDELFILTKHGQNLTRSIHHHFSKHHIEPKNIIETENLTTAINLVSEGLGFTFVPERGIIGKHLPDNIVPFTLNDPGLIWPLAVVYKKDTYLSKISSLLINHLKDHFNEDIDE